MVIVFNTTAFEVAQDTLAWLLTKFVVLIINQFYIFLLYASAISFFWTVDFSYYYVVFGYNTRYYLQITN